MRRSLHDFYQAIRINILAILGACAIKLIFLTIRWRAHGLKENIPLYQSKPGIFVLWHGRQLLMPCLYRELKHKGLRRKIYALISLHSDGRIIAKAVRYIGIHSVAGSSSRGGKEAMYELVRKIIEGSSVAITPDGPRGPDRRMKMGAIKMAKLTGAPLYPMAYSANRYWQFKSWDKMILPKPFSCGVFYVGDPVYIPKDASDADMERYMNEFEEILNSITRKADEYVYT